MTLATVGFGLLESSVVFVSVFVAVFLGFVLFWSGFYGGADLKALLFIAITTPTIPITLNPTLNLPPLPLILTIFCNSIILSLIWPLTIFSLNLKDTLKGKNMFKDIKLNPLQKTRLFFTARQTPLEKMEGLRYFPAEQIEIQNGQPTRKPLRLMKAETDTTKYLNNMKIHKHLYKKGALASPTIPTIAFFTITLTVAPLGNLFFWTITLLKII
jgi:hypothetical protein